MADVDAERRALAAHLGAQRSAILEGWRRAIGRDPALRTGDSLPRAQLFDHIPSILSAFEASLSGSAAADAETVSGAAEESAAAHGLQRWHQGYDLREVTRELGKLNECVVDELDRYTAANPAISHDTVAAARRIWAALCSTGIEASVGQYFHLQQQEAAGHVGDLENALAAIRDLERARADLWHQAAHDLRGNLGVVANATVGLAQGGLRETTRDDFMRILMRNVTTLHHLLDDVTSLARLQAGTEHRHVEPMDVAHLLQQLCEGIRPLAQQRHLFLRNEGPAGFAVDGDPVKIRRIAQNLILNAVKCTRQGGVTVRWGDSRADDAGRWELSIIDTGPGFRHGSAEPMVQALQSSDPVQAPAALADPDTTLRPEAGEGIGLSIVKRLCDLLDATIELDSVPDVGTTFRILFPRSYPLEA